MGVTANATTVAATRTLTRTEMLDAMRTAILQEITALKQRGGATMPADEAGPVGRTAHNGRLIFFMNGEQVYSFDLPRGWELAEDTFVRVQIPNTDPPVARVEVSGRASPESQRSGASRRILIASEEPLPANVLTSVNLQPDPMPLLTKLLESLDAANEGERKLASKAFGLLPIAGSALPEIGSADAQCKALKVAQTDEVLYVIGPPGTGKTRTLAEMAHQFKRQGMTLLIAAQTNIAVDNAIEQLASLHNQSAEKGVAGAIIRLGLPHLASLRRRNELSLAALAAHHLLAETQQQATLSQAALLAAHRELAELESQWGASVGTCERLRVEQEGTQGGRFLGKLLARGTSKRLADELRRAETKRDQSRAALEEQEDRERKAQQHHDLLSRRLRSLEHYAATFLTESERDTPPDDAASPPPQQILPELAREIFVEERRILDEAQVVGATLTKTYTSKLLEGRRFDVVIVDEASMASLPALYVAAARADQRVVLIGDPLQLPPIVKSKEAEATNWLGRDIFTAAHIGLQEAHEGGHHAVLLDQQRRMRAEVSLLARRFVYDNLLQDHPDVTRIPYPRIEPEPDHPLVLCDTSDARPVCSRPTSSRINIYHAICTFLLGLRALRSLDRRGPAEPPENGEFRVGLITPYRKQAELLQRLIETFDLEREMLAGTVHRFQGLECDVVVFDTVESEGLSPTRLTVGGAGTEAQRLTNVAITRGRHKLIIVANMDHLERRLGGGSNGSGAVGRHTLLDVVREAGKSNVMDSRRFVSLDSVTGGNSDETIEAIVARLARMFQPLSGEEFDAKLREDLMKVQRGLVIVSPFVTEARVAEILPRLREAMSRGVRVRVVTGRRSSNRNDRVSATAIAALIEAGVKHDELPGLHQKVVVVDEGVAYVGSLNPLSYTGRTRELMLRIEDAELVKSLHSRFA